MGSLSLFRFSVPGSQFFVLGFGATHSGVQGGALWPSNMRSRRNRERQNVISLSRSAGRLCRPRQLADELHRRFPHPLRQRAIVHDTRERHGE